MKRILYLSEAHIDEDNAEVTVSEIAAEIQRRSAVLSLTGGLIFTGTHFAQVLEGSPEGIDELIGSIDGNYRHGKINVVDQSPITERRFSGWKIAYNGSSQFVAQHVTHLLHTTSERDRWRAAQKLIEMIYKFSITQPVRMLRQL